MNAPRAGFTLAEIAFSLLLVSIAVVTVLLFFPVGIQVQMQARYKVLAAAKALEMIEQFRTGNDSGLADSSILTDKEGVFPWDTTLCYSNNAYDLDAFCMATSYSLKPLPLTIATRLDSDRNEIGGILDRGGYVYYCDPAATGNGLANVADVGGYTNESGRLIVGIVGHPQQNALLYHPSVKVGAYHSFFPSPPTHARESLLQRPADPAMPTIEYDVLARDPLIQHVNNSPDTWTHSDGSVHQYGFWPYHLRLMATPMAPATPSAAELDLVRASACHYVAACLWYCDQVGLDPGTLDPETDTPDDTQWRRVLAMRYLAHAGACLTRWYDGTTPITIDGVVQGTAINRVISIADVQQWHENSLRLAVRHADKRGPYDWGAPRPLNRQTMMDYPLLEADIFGDPVVATTGGIERSQWRALYPRAIRNPGLPYSYCGRFYDTNSDGFIDALDGINDPATPGRVSYPARVLDTDGDGDLDQNDTPVPRGPGTWQPAVGDPRRFNLLRPFAASERCREIVVWAVDWQSYEDFETAPSAPVDSARYPSCAPFNFSVAGQDAYTSDSVQFTDSIRQYYSVSPWSDWWNIGQRNPECKYLFVAPSVGQERREVSTIGAVTNGNPDRGLGSAASNIFLGKYGANRNGDGPMVANSYFGVVSAGPISKSIRLRAVTIARFNYYDPRMMGPLRQ